MAPWVGSCPVSWPHGWGVVLSHGPMGGELSCLMAPWVGSCPVSSWASSYIIQVWQIQHPEPVTILDPRFISSLTISELSGISKALVEIGQSRDIFLQDKQTPTRSCKMMWEVETVNAREKENNASAAIICRYY